HLPAGAGLTPRPTSPHAPEFPMTASLPTAYAEDASGARPLHVLTAAGYEAWLASQPEATRAWLQAQQFKAGAGTHALLPGEGGVAGAAIGIGDPLDAYSYAHAPTALPEGAWAPAGDLSAEHLAT